MDATAKKNRLGRLRLNYTTSRKKDCTAFAEQARYMKTMPHVLHREIFS